jgi:hypothetical protein
MNDRPSYTVRILHISDLHERGSREQHPARRQRVLGDAWLKNLEALLMDGPIHLVCFTGDLADWGQPSEYAAATAFFRRTLQTLGLTNEKLFVIPGNHDMARTVEGKSWMTLRTSLPRVDGFAISQWVAGGVAPLTLSDNDLDRVLSRQAAFWNWVGESLERRDLLPETSRHGRLGYSCIADLTDIPFDVHVIGFDSAWLSGDDSDAGRLRLTSDQVLLLTTDQQGNPLGGLRVALVHHPFGDLQDGAECRRLLAERVDLLLRGHLHDTEPFVWSDPDRSLVQFAVGSLYEGGRGDDWPNACAVIDIVCDSEGRPLRHEVRFRGWSSRGHWHDDGSLYNAGPHGRITVTAPASAGGARGVLLTHGVMLDLGAVYEGGSDTDDTDIRFSVSNRRGGDITVTDIQVVVLEAAPLNETLGKCPAAPLLDRVLYAKIGPNTESIHVLPSHHVLRPGETDGFKLIVKGEEGYRYAIAIRIAWHPIPRLDQRQPDHSLDSGPITLTYRFHSAQGLLALAERRRKEL